MASGKFTIEQQNELSRESIKKLIKTYNQSKAQDQKALEMIIEQLARTPLYFAVDKDCDTSNPSTLRFITLRTDGKVFVPMFTGKEEFGKLDGQVKVVSLQPETYLEMLLSNNHHAVVNPFGSYFLMWPELMKDYMLPFVKETAELKKNNQPIM